MQSRIGLWGGSCALRLPKMAMETLGLKEGEEVSLTLDDGALIIRPARKNYDLDTLAAEALSLTPPTSLDDGAMGDEAL